VQRADFDGQIQLEVVPPAVLASIQEKQRDKMSKQPPVYRRIMRSIYVVPRESVRGEGSAQELASLQSGDLCPCARLGTECGDECPNRELCMECTPRICGYGKDDGRKCRNRAISRRENAKVRSAPTPGKGWGLFAADDLPAGQFVIEYVGELIDGAECEKRMQVHKEQGQTLFHMLEVHKDLIIDAGYMGNESRFINHSCAPNCIALKKHVGSETRVGIFTRRPIPAGTELTYDYQFVNFALERWECQCGEPSCRRYLGVNLREAIDAAALKMAGVHAELRRAGDHTGAAAAAAAATSSPTSALLDAADCHNVGDGSSPSVPSRVLRGKFRMAALNPTVLHACRSPLPEECDPLAALRGVALSAADIQWARQQRLFLVGKPMPTPNIFDDTPAATHAAEKLVGHKRRRPGPTARRAAVTATATGSTQAAAMSLPTAGMATPVARPVVGSDSHPPSETSEVGVSAHALHDEGAAGVVPPVCGRANDAWSTW
ncbi:MAG: SET domain-containing protein, partial [Methanosarcinales archaeon]